MQQINCVLIMPAYNEEDCLSRVLRSWEKELQRHFGSNYRLIVVNDGSTDQTARILDQEAERNRQLVPIHQKNGGHGKALMTAYKTALTLPAEFIFQVDSDDQFEVADFQKLWNRRLESKFILGHRLARHDGIHRLAVSKILRATLLVVFRIDIKDANIPFRLIRSPYLRSLLVVMPDRVFAPNVFLSVLAARHGQSLLSIPVTHVARKTGQITIVRWTLVKVCLRSVRELLSFRLRLPTALSRLAESEQATSANPIVKAQ